MLRSIEAETRWVFSAGGNDGAVAELERQVWIFLARLKQGGALAGATLDQAFYIRTSAALEPPGDVAVALRIGFSPRAPNEFVIYDFRYHASTLTTEIVPVGDAERHLG